MIDVVIVDDHPVVRAGLRAVIDDRGGMRVTHECDSAEELLRHLRAGHAADVILLDLHLGDGRMNGAEGTRRVVAEHRIPVLVVTTYGSDADILAAVEAGATGYVLKDAPTEALADAIMSAANGDVVLAPEVQRRLVGRMRSPALSLTPRELEVLALVAAGSSNVEVAARLVVSVATVKTHLAHAYDKLGARNRTEAVATARAKGILPR